MTGGMMALGTREEVGSGADRGMAGRGMSDCCQIAPVVSARQRRVLRIVLGINLAMFAGELAAALLARSTALLADAADMLGDAMVYGFSLAVVARGSAWQARAALLKGAVMGAFGLGVLVEAALKLAGGLVPTAQVMGGVGALALLANGAVLALLWSSRGDDLNMRSAWLCSRNDVIANLAVLVAAGGVTLTGSPWPDVGVGLGIAALFGAAALDVVRAARRALAAR
jgi:Co/Zn/Cd efflux system component